MKKIEAFQHPLFSAKVLFCFPFCFVSSFVLCSLCFVSSFVSTGFNFLMQIIPKINAYLKNLKLFSEKELYEKSLLYEPRK